MPWQFSYAGVDLPPPDADGFVPELQPVDDAERNANADLIIEEIAMKRKIPVSWSRMNGEQVTKIFSTLEANRTGELVYYDLAKGAITTMQAYYGAGVKASFRRYDENLKSQIWSAIAVNFIEM